MHFVSAESTLNNNQAINIVEQELRTLQEHMWSPLVFD